MSRVVCHLPCFAGRSVSRNLQQLWLKLAMYIGGVGGVDRSGRWWSVLGKDTLDAANNDAEQAVVERLQSKKKYVDKLEAIFKAIDTTGDGMITEDGSDGRRAFFFASRPGEPHSNVRVKVLSSWNASSTKINGTARNQQVMASNPSPPFK